MSAPKLAANTLGVGVSKETSKWACKGVKLRASALIRTRLATAADRRDLVGKMTDRMTTRGALGVGLVLFGVAVGANALVSGPHAFALGWGGVLTMAAAGTGCVVAGILQVARCHKARGRE